MHSQLTERPPIQYFKQKYTHNPTLPNIGILPFPPKYYTLPDPSALLPFPEINTTLN